jgi:hypothetical protein
MQGYQKLDSQKSRTSETPKSRKSHLQAHMQAIPPLRNHPQTQHRPPPPLHKYELQAVVDPPPLPTSAHHKRPLNPAQGVDSYSRRYAHSVTIGHRGGDVASIAAAESGFRVLNANAPWHVRLRGKTSERL